MLPSDAPQTVILKNRASLSLTGVTDVTEFAGEEVIFETEDGLLTVTGEGLRLSKFLSDSGEAFLTGRVDSLSYSERGLLRQGLFRRKGGS